MHAGRAPFAFRASRVAERSTRRKSSTIVWSGARAGAAIDRRQDCYPASYLNEMLTRAR
jgi:hypothetical protein